MDTEVIKKAMDHFENDQFMDAKELLQKEIHTRRNEFLKDKLGLKNDIEPVQTTDEE
jgi:hypothetical protein